MPRSIAFSALCTVVLSLSLPPSALAQRGGNRGGFGGGFSSGHISGYRGGFGGFTSGYIRGYRGSVASFRWGYSGYGGYYGRGFYPRYSYYPRYYGYPGWGFNLSLGYGYWPYYDNSYYYYGSPGFYWYPSYRRVVLQRSVMPYRAGDLRDEPAATRPAPTERYSGYQPKRRDAYGRAY
jgi:hypothetical protein